MPDNSPIGHSFDRYRDYGNRMAEIHLRPHGTGVVVPHEATGGVISFVELSMDPRHLIRGHVHARTDVWIHVLSGQVGVRVRDDEAIGTAGDYLLKPRGIPHAMWNPGDEANRLIEILTPGDGDGFFRDAAALPEDVSAAEFEAMAARHGITYFDDWTEDLRARYGLE
jgi:quercetin dioxygenase-like cupin family protein